jgi:hypothetical protein
MSWNFHIEEIIPKLNKASLAIRSIKPYMSYEVVRMIYFLIFILLCHMALYSGVIHLKIIQYSRFKKEQLELL